jgi:hypothetical protein
VGSASGGKALFSEVLFGGTITIFTLTNSNSTLELKLPDLGQAAYIHKEKQKTFKLYIILKKKHFFSSNAFTQQHAPGALFF